MPEEHCIVVFPSTHYALKAERGAIDAGIDIRMIPVPRKLSPDCTMGMETSIENEDALRKALHTVNVECRFVRLSQ